MEFKRLAIPEVILVTTKVFGDDRGCFLETYKKSRFVENGIDLEFVQDNCSFSQKSVLRGLHYQMNPHAQGKLVRCSQGKIFDVAVDIRQGSTSYGHWVGEMLDDERHQMLWVPPGFAHGFVVLSDSAWVHYKTTAEYAPEADRGILWNDSDINVDWGITDPVLSPKDAGLPALKEAENNFTSSS